MIELISSYLIWGLSNFTGQNACANNYQSQHLTTHSTESQTISTNYAGNGLNGPVTGTNVGSAIPRPLLNVNWSHIFRLLLLFFLYSISVDSQNITVEWLSDVCCLLFFFSCISYATYICVVSVIHACLVLRACSVYFAGDTNMCLSAVQHSCSHGNRRYGSVSGTSGVGRRAWLRRTGHCQ